jgi:hypothetical protein
MTSLANATIKTSPLLGNHQVFRSALAGSFLLDDLNNLMTLAKRVNTSWIGGTPTTRTRGITDLIVSPEIIASIRAMAYNPVNTRGGNGFDGAGTAATANPIAAPESLREELFRNAGLDSFMGLNLLEFNEMGKGQKFNTIFDTASTANFAKFDGTSASAVFNGANEEIVVGVDRTRDSLIRVVSVDPDSNSEMNLIADDQYSVRQNKIGYYGQIEEGRVVLDNRVLLGVIV